MISPVTASPNAQVPTSASAVSKAKSDLKSSPSTHIQDTVQLSPTAQAQLSSLKAAMQEATETPAQTAKEAQGGDLQARRLLATEAAAAKLAKGK